MQTSISPTPTSLFVRGATLMLVIAYLPALAAWYLPARVWWPLGIASMAFAFLWPLLLLFAICWFRKNKKVFAFFLLLLVAGVPPAAATFSPGWRGDFTVQKQPGHVRVMQWNCANLPGNLKEGNKYKSQRKAASEFIRQYSPDIICLQDFTELEGKRAYSNIKFLKDSLGYPFCLFGNHATVLQRHRWVKLGVVIFSRIAPLRQGMLPLESSGFSDKIVWADFLLDDKPFRVVTTHFSSMQLFSHETFNGKKLPYYMRQDSAYIMSPDILKKLRYYQAKHVQQALTLRAFLDTCSVPVVLAADLNSVPASHVYRTVRGDLKDGYLGSKWGMGATYNYLSPNLRIDYLLNHHTLRASQWKHFEDGFFDHDHLLADFAWGHLKTK